MYYDVMLFLHDFDPLPHTATTEFQHQSLFGTPTMTPQPLSMDIFAASMASVMEPILGFTDETWMGK